MDKNTHALAQALYERQVPVVWNDLPRYEEIQQEWNQRDCPDGVMSRLWRWVRESPA